MIKNTDYLDLFSEKRVNETGLSGVILLIAFLSGNEFAIIMACVFIIINSFCLEKENKKYRQRLQE